MSKHKEERLSGRIIIARYLECGLGEIEVEFYTDIGTEQIELVVENPPPKHFELAAGCPVELEATRIVMLGIVWATIGREFVRLQSRKKKGTKS